MRGSAMTDSEIDEIACLRADMDERFEKQGEKLEAFRVFLLRAFFGVALAIGSGVVGGAVVVGSAMERLSDTDELAREAKALARANDVRLAAVEGSARVADERFGAIQSRLDGIAADLREIVARELTGRRGYPEPRP